MNIAEKFSEKQRIEQKSAETARQEKVQKLADKIITALSDKEAVESIENYLLEKGTVSIGDFGCLCQDGCCTWQRGLSGLLQPLVAEWKTKGVIVRPSLSLEFRVETARVSLFRDDKKTINQIKEWNKLKK